MAGTSEIHCHVRTVRTYLVKQFVQPAFQLRNKRGGLALVLRAL